MLIFAGFFALGIGPLTAGAQSLTLIPNAELVRRVTDAPRDNLERAARLAEWFRAAGCEPLLHPVGGKKRADNVECILPGESDEVILIGGHTDRSPGSPGVVDNWSGTVMLSALYEALASSPRAYTFAFVGFSAEEEGLIGSRAYVKRLDKEAKRKIRAMINLDTVGSGPLQMETELSDDLLLRAFITTLNMDGSKALGMNVGNRAESDYLPFRLANIPVLVLHSLRPDQINKLHTSEDNQDLLDLPTYYKNYRQVAMVSLLIEKLLQEQAVEAAP